MPPVRSAGLLVFRRRAGELEVLLAHPGGPYWARKDDGAWSVPKGELEEDEDPLMAAQREFAEELGRPAPVGEPISLGEVVQKNRKVVVAWAVEGDLDPDSVVSNMFEIEWPPRSGEVAAFPEIDRVAWFDPVTARQKLNPAQAAFIDRLVARLAPPSPP